MKKLFYPLIILLLATSCNKLTKEKAIELISQNKEFPKRCGIKLPQSFTIYYIDDDFKTPNESLISFDKYSMLKAEGYITYTEQQRVSRGTLYNGWFAERPLILYQISLTEKGKSLAFDESTLSGIEKEILSNEDEPYYLIHIGDIYVNDVSLIQKEDNASATYTLTLKDTIPNFKAICKEWKSGFFIDDKQRDKYGEYSIQRLMGKSYYNIEKDELATSTASFHKWDDGWKIDK